MGYLLEWVAIIWVGALGVGETVVRGASANELLDTYSGHVDALTTMAGWFSLVLLFRILLFIGLRQSLVDSGYRHPLMDFAVAAAAVSVTLEVASYGLGAAAGGFAKSGDRGRSAGARPGRSRHQSDDRGWPWGRHCLLGVLHVENPACSRWR